MHNIATLLPQAYRLTKPRGTQGICHVVSWTDAFFGRLEDQVRARSRPAKGIILFSGDF